MAKTHILPVLEAVLAYVLYQLDTARVIWEEGIFIEKMPLVDGPEVKSIEQFLDD